MSERHIAVTVTTRASRTAVDADGSGGLRVRVTAAPVDGQANAAVIRAVADWLAVPRRQVRLESGPASRRKVLAVPAAAWASRIGSDESGGAVPSAGPAATKPRWLGGD